MKVAIYSRKSRFTGKGDSIENQVQMCKEYMQRNFPDTSNFEFEIFEDEGFSGGNTNRPEFQKLINDIKNKKFQVLICYRLDRISRNVADFSATLELLQANNCDFISIKEQFDTSTPMGRAMVYISSVFAQLERETIAERVRDNMLELAKSGRWLGGQTPLGFESEKISYLDNEFKERSMYKLIPIENELKTVKVIYEKYYDTKSLRQTLQYLLEHNYKTKMNKDCNLKQVRDVLVNPTYVKANKNIFEYLSSKGILCVGTPNGTCGLLSYNKSKNVGLSRVSRNFDEWIIATAKHKGIIDADIWLDIQKTLEENKTKAPKLGKSYATALSGYVKCAKCKNGLHVIHTGRTDKNGNKTLYYKCKMKIDSNGTRCDNKNIRADELESAVISQLKKAKKDNSLITNELQKVKSEICSSNSNNEVDTIKNELEKTNIEINNLVENLSQNSSSVAAKYIISEIEKKEKYINELNEKLSKLNDNSTVLKLENNIELFLSCLDKFYYNIDSAISVEEKRALILPLIDEITWNGDTGELDIQLWGSKKK